MRKLLPYEQAIAKELGLTEEEYYEFICAQAEYNDIKQGTLLDARNMPVSLIFAIVGVIFQVAGALLAPKPKQQENKSEQASTRDQIFAPRFGFNSSQEIAKYGDPVNLVYTNIDQNNRGGVRVKTSLVFSAVNNYGSHQMMNVMGVIGASPVDVDINRTAFGQLPLRRLGGSEIWAYLGSGGAARVNDLRFGRPGGDPLTRNLQGTAPAARITSFDGDFNGFSQTFTPSTSTTCGVVGVIPINTDVAVLDPSGDRRLIFVPVVMTQGRAEHWTAARTFIEGGGIVNITLEQLTQNVSSGNYQGRARNNGLLSAFAALDAGATYKLGSALFEVESISPTYISEGPVFVSFRCIRRGRFPLCPYELQHWLDGSDQNVPNATEVFFTKCFGKVEQIRYTTVTKCNIVELSLRCQVFRRISGRQNVYGRDQNDYGDNASDNGLKPKVSMFMVFVSIDQGPLERIPYIFAVRGDTEQDMYNFVRIADLGGSHIYEIIIEPVLDVNAEQTSWSCLGYCYIVDSGSPQRRNTVVPNVFFEWNGFIRNFANSPFLPINDSPDATNEWDLFHSDATTQYQLSSDRGAEITLTSVTEQLWGLNISAGFYTLLSTLTIHARSGAGIRDLRSMSAWVTRGNWVRPLNAPSTYEDSSGNINESAYISFSNSQPSRSTSYAPEVMVESVLNKLDGIGAYSSVFSLDLAGISRAHQFCVRNGLFFDGVVADVSAWREFWARVAPFSLLELAKVGGRETLVPAVPYNPSTYEITRDIGNVSGVFGPGNIIEGSLKKDYIEYGADTQDVIVTLIYRDTEINDAFPRNNSVTVQLRAVNELDASRQTIDVSAYVSRREQCIMLGKYLCNTKRHFREAIEFRTYPVDTPIFPGSYFIWDSGETEWQSVYTGTVEPGGTLNSPAAPDIPNGSYTVMLYQGGNGIVTLQGVSISNNTSLALAGYPGWVFVLGITSSSQSIYRTIEVTLEDDEGDGVTIKAMIHPCDINGTQRLSKVADFGDFLFTVT